MYGILKTYTFISPEYLQHITAVKKKKIQVQK